METPTAIEPAVALSGPAVMAPPTPPNDAPPQAIDLAQAGVIIALFDEPDNHVGVQVLFRENPPPLENNTTWIAEFLLVNWGGIVGAAAKARVQTEQDAANAIEVFKGGQNSQADGEFKLFTASGGTLQ